MNNQTRNHLNLQKHIAGQDHIIRVRNAEIAALRKRAEKAEQERDEWEKIARTTERDADEAEENPRPLTADDITDEMVKRAREEFFGRNVGGPVSGPSSARRWRAALTAALTEPPRSEGAEELGELIGEYLDSTPGVDDKGMADFLAEHGVRIVEEMNR